MVAYVLHKGRTLPVVAKVRSNGIACVAVMEAPGKPTLIPLGKVIAAPVRSRPVLIWRNPNV